MGKRLELPTFDELMEFHRRDPIGYEHFRMETLNTVVDAAPLARRSALLKTLQAIETTRKAADTPWTALVAAHALMCESLRELGAALHRLQHAGAEVQTAQVIARAKKAALRGTAGS
jgi:hypothetical protein